MGIVLISILLVIKVKDAAAVAEIKDVTEDNNGRSRQRFLPATFADLPARTLDWEQMPSAPVPRLDGYSIQIKNKLYVFSGYGTIDHVRIFLNTMGFFCLNFEITVSKTRMLFIIRFILMWMCMIS